MTEFVYIFSAWQARPKYHIYGRTGPAYVQRDLESSSADVTVCGLVIYDSQSRFDAYLRRDHAELFAEPCRKCFEVGGSAARPSRGVCDA